MRGNYERHGNPARALAHRALVAREDDLLTQATEHLHREGFVADDEVDPAFVRKGRGGDRFLVECGDHGAINGIGDAGFGRIDAVAEAVKGGTHVVGAQFVRIADAHPVRRICVDKAHEPAVERMHGAIGRRAFVGPLRLRQARRRRPARRQRMPALRGTLLLLVNRNC